MERELRQRLGDVPVPAAVVDRARAGDVDARYARLARGAKTAWDDEEFVVGAWYRRGFFLAFNYGKTFEGIKRDGERERGRGREVPTGESL